MANVLPFTWSKLQSMHGPIRRPEVKRIKAAITEPTPATWARARSVIVDGRPGIRCSTLWQCVEAVTLKRFPDGYVPSSREIIMGLCYATGEPFRK